MLSFNFLKKYNILKFNILNLAKKNTSYIQHCYLSSTNYNKYFYFFRRKVYLSTCKN